MMIKQIHENEHIMTWQVKDITKISKLKKDIKIICNNGVF